MTTLTTDIRHDIVIEDVEYQRQGGRAMLARLYRPGGAGPFPAVLQVHGGAWVNKDRTDNDFIAKALAESGIVVASIDFRMPPEALSRLAGRYQPRRTLAQGQRGHHTAAPIGSAASALRAAGIRCCSRLCGRRILATGRCRCRGAAVDARLAFVISGWGVLDPLLRYELAKKAGNAELLENHHSFWGDAAAMEEGNPPRCSSAARRSSCRRLWSSAATSDEWVPVELMRKFAADCQKAGGQVELQLYEVPTTAL